MMANAITGITHQFSTPYLTLTEYKNAPTAIDYDNLVVGGNAAAQDAELTNVIARASSWVDTYCNQILGATSENEQQRTRVKNDGTIRFHPRYAPIIALTALSYGSDPNNLTTVTDCSVCWVEDAQIIFPYSRLSTTWSSQGPLQFGFPSNPSVETFLRYTYVNGYANTLINTATAAATSLTVTDGTGVVAGQMLKIYDGVNSENVTVASTYTFGSTTVPLTSALAYSHATGISISSLPPAVKEAAILATTAFLKVRGDNSLVMAVTTRPSAAPSDAQNIKGDLGLAMELLKPFRRMR
jgi:hypothetical protein